MLTLVSLNIECVLLYITSVWLTAVEVPYIIIRELPSTLIDRIRLTGRCGVDY